MTSQPYNIIVSTTICASTKSPRRFAALERPSDDEWCRLLCPKSALLVVRSRHNTGSSCTVCVRPVCIRYRPSLLRMRNYTSNTTMEAKPGTRPRWTLARCIGSSKNMGEMWRKSRSSHTKRKCGMLVDDHHEDTVEDLLALVCFSLPIVIPH